jgi:O-antigen/teichoic acid export membrane protein
MNEFRSGIAAKLHRIVEFLTSQGITMAGNLLFGFLCVRLLPIPDYAQYVVVFGFLGTLMMLMDSGTSNALLPLVGEQIDNRQLVADYVASLRQLAQWLYLLFVPAAIFLFPLMVRKQQWNSRVIAAMLMSILIGSWFTRVSGQYGAVLIIRRDRKSWYRIQMISSLSSLALLGVVYVAHWLTAFTAIGINLAGTTFMATAYFLRARHLLGVRGRPSRQARGELIHLAMPNVPSVIFYALQGQISLLLITLFGRTTAVASVGALNRLGQIYILPGQMNMLLVEPYFARLPRSKVKSSYLAAIMLAGLLCASTTAMARYFPEIFLWILGPKYSHLRFEVFIVVATSSLGYLSAVLWTMNSARRFVYWWNSAAIILLTVVVQAVFIWRVNLSTVRPVLLLGLATVIVNLIVYGFVGLYGFVYGPRVKINRSIAVQQEVG